MLSVESILTRVRDRVSKECLTQKVLSCQAVILTEELVASINAEMQARGSRMVRPALPEVELHFAKIGLPQSEAARFHAHFESNGWKVGKNPMKSWHHASTTWKANWQERAGRNGQAQDLAPALRVQLNKELDSTTDAMRRIKATYQDGLGRDWTPSDKERFNTLLARKKELKATLGIKI